MNQKISCLIYDMDGLLLDTEGIYTEVTQDIVGEFGKVFDWSVKKTIIGRPASQAAKIIVESLDLPITPQDYLDSRKDVLIEKFKNTQPMPGAKEMTTHFFSHGLPQAIATSSSSPIYDAKYKKHKKWFSQFTQIVRGDDPELKQGKPAPDIFLETADQMGLKPHQLCVVEDSVAGVSAARAAGMQVMAITNSFPAERLVEADRIVSDYGEIRRLLLG